MTPMQGPSGEVKGLTKTQISLLVLLDSLLGAFIGPLNLAFAMMLMSLLYGGLPRFVPPDLATLFADLSSKESLVVALPCFLSTAVLAPFLIHFLAKEAGRPLSGALGKGALWGVAFGIVATFVTCVLALVLSGLREPASSPALFLLRLGGLVLLGTLGAPAFVFWCFPFILISGTLFGMFNLALIRLLWQGPGREKVSGGPGL